MLPDLAGREGVDALLHPPIVDLKLRTKEEDCGDASGIKAKW